MKNTHKFILVQTQEHTIFMIHSNNSPDGVNKIGEEDDETMTYDPPDVVPLGDE
jgi:hypothetical protein